LPDISKWNVNNILNLNSLFFNCSSLISLPDISKWNIFNSNIKISDEHYKYIFEDEDRFDSESLSCQNKSFIDSLYIDNVQIQIFKQKSLNIEEKKKKILNIAYNMSGLFGRCSSLKELPDISKWNISNVNNISNLFLDCSSLKLLPDISIWDTSNIKNISNLFNGCSSLVSLPDISKWNINKVSNMKGLFSGCSKLKELPDISKWDINTSTKLKLNNFIKNNYSSFNINSNKIYFNDYVERLIYRFMIVDISYLFYQCSSLEKLPDISKWNTTYIKNMNYLFYGCSSLKELPDISKWNMQNVKNISYMFFSCSSLKALPDISKWNTKYIENLDSIFENCALLTFIPDISKWELNHNITINNIFSGCNSLLSIPDILKWNIKMPKEFKLFPKNPIIIKKITSLSNSYSNLNSIKYLKK